MSDGGVDGELGQISQHPKVIVLRCILGQLPLHLPHFVRRLEQACKILTHPAHCLGIGGIDAENPQVMQYILGSHSFRANAAFGEGHILGNTGVQMMTYHEHVHVLGQRVHCVGPGGIGGRGQHIKLAGDADNIRRMAAPGSFGMVGVNRAPIDGGNSVLKEACLVEGVGVNRHRHIVGVGHPQAAIDGRWSSAPVLMQLQAAGPGRNLFLQRSGLAGVSLPHYAPIDRQTLRRFQHPVNVPRPRGAGGGLGAVGGTGATSKHGGYSVGQGMVYLLGGNHMNVGVDTAGGGN